MFQSYGRIMKPSFEQKEGWFVLKADDSIGDYYNWFYRRAFKDWDSCMNGCHITFVAGEKDDRIVNKEELSIFYDKDINFYYDSTIYTNGRAFWLPVISKDLEDIRLFLGLKPKILYHITLGNNKNDLKRIENGNV